MIVGMFPTIEWRPEAVVMVDQRKLPAQEVYVHCKTPVEVARAIKTMVIRGAPAIGVAAAMGLALWRAQVEGSGDAPADGRVHQDLRPDGLDATNGGEPLLGD